jgi:hypothetical protein
MTAQGWEEYVQEAYPTFGDPGREIRAAYEAGYATGEARRPLPERYSPEWALGAPEEDIAILDAVTDILMRVTTDMERPMEERLSDPITKRYGDWALDIMRAVRGE